MKTILALLCGWFFGIATVLIVGAKALQEVARTQWDVVETKVAA